MINDLDLLNENNNNEKIHIRLKQRNTKKTWTIIDNITIISNEDNDLKKILKHLKKTNQCNGSISIEKETNKKILILQGDKRQQVKEHFLNDHKLDENIIVIHG
ncbi:hypothetical protein Hokovirus_1_87 [Hokovirus HKV1]|uniref:SUI1 domain-containing protein n=1 Tax=Hokovirus HKV1 TaxID=1977638 RepID=A0A1V0SEZ5_9VIRU|nr:hypothetical protein Hokovirus_1_87 [Hokovirus HKV1]